MTGASCDFGDVENGRQGHTMCGDLICGGERWGAPRARTCWRFDGSPSLTKLPLTTTHERGWHLCWALPSGEVMLLGGDRAGGAQTPTTEVISADGSSSRAGWNLEYSFW